jgi:hypothetical protein
MVLRSHADVSTFPTKIVRTWCGVEFSAKRDVNEVNP